MPPRRSKRAREYSPPPSPIPSIHSEREPSLTPPPQLPTPEALINVDVVFQILKHVDRPTLAKCLTLSVTFHAAAGRLFYQHVKLLNSDTVLKILHQTNPVRQTRKHTQKVLTPLPFFKYTTYLTVRFHDVTAFPTEWMQQLGALFPNVRSIRINTPTGCAKCKKNSFCAHTMWKLASILPVERVSINLEEMYHGRRYTPKLNSMTLLPSGLSFKSAKLSIICDGFWELRNHDEGLGSRWRESTVTSFASIELVVTQFSRNRYCGDLSPLVGDLARSAIWTNANPLDDWMQWTRTISGIAEDLTTFVSGTKAIWVFYNLSNEFPQSATYWPASHIQPGPKDDATIELLMNKALNRSGEQLSHENAATGDDQGGIQGPKLIFKSRKEYLSTLTHPEDLSYSVRERIEKLELRTTKDYGEVTGLYGNWVMHVCLGTIR